ncbi:MAG: hypothetical protein CMM62_05595 [Rhodospirillaceae bacterium]|nr:hypothetical protein [Rhodospirillaceae bacterium]
MRQLANSARRRRSKQIRRVVSRGLVNTKSLSFDGTNDRAGWGSGVIESLIGAGDWSWSYWVKSSDFSQAGTGQYSTLIYALNFYGAGVSTFIIGAIGENSHSSQAGKLTVIATRGTGAGSTYFSWVSDSSVIGSLTDDDWNHIVITCDTGASSRAIKAYINGSEVAGADALSNQAATDFSGINMGDVALGTQTFNAGSDSFDALELDEISLYSSVLSSSNVTAIYNGGVPADETERSGLIGYWRLEDNGNDSSSNSNSLTISGAQFTTDVPS